MAERRPFRFEKLEVWQSTRALTKLVYSLSDTFPQREQLGLTSQLRRAVVSIGANIAEGSGKNSDRDFARFLEQAYGSAMECASLILLAMDLGYLKQASADETLERLHGLSNQIAALNRSLNIEHQKTVIPKTNGTEANVRRPSTFDSRPST
jgi:four helix bundle protein